MPLIRAELWEGRSDEERAKLIKALTEATASSIGCPKEAVWVVVYDVPKKNWGIGGEPCAR